MIVTAYVENNVASALRGLLGLRVEEMKILRDIQKVKEAYAKKRMPELEEMAKNLGKALKIIQDNLNAGLKEQEKLVEIYEKYKNIK